jgi:hypothetical protein
MDPITFCIVIPISVLIEPVIHIKNREENIFVKYFFTIKNKGSEKSI